MAVEKSNGSGARAKKKKSRRERTGEFAARLAPPEETQGKVQPLALSEHDGDFASIVVNTGKLELPKNFDAGDDGGSKQSAMPDPAVIFILAIFLLFIFFIARLISLEEPKPDYTPVKIVSQK